MKKKYKNSKNSLVRLKLRYLLKKKNILKNKNYNFYFLIKSIARLLILFSQKERVALVNTEFFLVKEFFNLLLLKKVYSKYVFRLLLKFRYNLLFSKCKSDFDSIFLNKYNFFEELNSSSSTHFIIKNRSNFNNYLFFIWYYPCLNLSRSHFYKNIYKKPVLMENYIMSEEEEQSFMAQYCSMRFITPKNKNIPVFLGEKTELSFYSKLKLTLKLKIYNFWGNRYFFDAFSYFWLMEIIGHWINFLNIATFVEYAELFHATKGRKFQYPDWFETFHPSGIIIYAVEEPEGKYMLLFCWLFVWLVDKWVIMKTYFLGEVNSFEAIEFIATTRMKLDPKKGHYNVWKDEALTFYNIFQHDLKFNMHYEIVLNGEKPVFLEFAQWEEENNTEAIFDWDIEHLDQELDVATGLPLVLVDKWETKEEENIDKEYWKGSEFFSKKSVVNLNSILSAEWENSKSYKELNTELVVNLPIYEREKKKKKEAYVLDLNNSIKKFETSINDLNDNSVIKEDVLSILTKYTKKLESIEDLSTLDSLYFDGLTADFMHIYYSKFNEEWYNNYKLIHKKYSLLSEPNRKEKNEYAAKMFLASLDWYDNDDYKTDFEKKKEKEKKK